MSQEIPIASEPEARALDTLFCSDPCQLSLDEVEEVERLTMRWVFAAFIVNAEEIKAVFTKSPDSPGDVAEDLTRETLDYYRGYPAGMRVWSKVDFRRAQWVTLPNHIVRQALLIDSKAEKNRPTNARLQIGQTSLIVRQRRNVEGNIEVQGLLPKCMTLDDNRRYLTTTILVAYHYTEHPIRMLQEIVICSVPNGLLQDRYNPTYADGIWLVGPDAPSRGEEFRTRVSFKNLKNKASWRVQRIQWRDSQTTSFTITEL